MRTVDRRWGPRGLRSAGAALAVAVVLVTVWWLASPRDAEAGGASAGGEGHPGDPGDLVVKDGGADGTVVDPGVASVGKDPVLPKGAVRVDSYVVRGHRLLLNYTTGVPECYGEVRLDGVEEAPHAVTVRLRSTPPTETPEVCIDLAVTGTLVVPLRDGLGERDVVDGSFEPTVQVARVARPYAAPPGGVQR